MASKFLCGSTRNKGDKHQYTQSNISHNKRKWNLQKHFRGNNSNNINHYNYNYRNELNVDSSISNLEEADHDENDNENINQNGDKEEEEEEEEEEDYEENNNIDSNRPQISIDRSREFNLNYHGHIENHASPRQVTPKSSNPYELIIDQKKLHKIVKSVHYPVEYRSIHNISQNRKNK